MPISFGSRDLVLAGKNLRGRWLLLVFAFNYESQIPIFFLISFPPFFLTVACCLLLEKSLEDLYAPSVTVWFTKQNENLEHNESWSAT